MRGQYCNCIALYASKDSGFDFAAWYTFACDWLSTRQLPPDTICVAGRGYNNQPLPFAKADEQIKSTGFGGIESLQLYSTIPFYKQLVFGWRAFAGMSAKSNVVDVAIDDTLVAWDGQVLKRLSKDLSRFLNAGYGIGYRREFKKGPELYAYGMASGLGYDKRDMHEADMIAKWFREMNADRRYLHGFLRDIYPLNVLSASHLQQKVAGQDFKSWLSSAPQLGSLEQISETLWCWLVDPADIDSVRRTLAAHNWLLCGSGGPNDSTAAVK